MDMIVESREMSMESPDMKGPPTPSPPIPGLSNMSAARRPPRKSTLTQQQKNQKRQRATQDQLVMLEVEFNKNPTPTAVVRERIAQDINMTERSVQIWFQNRRAKIKNIARKSIENGEDCEGIPESMRRHLAMQALDSGKGFFPNMMGPNASFASYGSGAMSLNSDSSTGKVVIQHFNCRSLSIGSWRRVGQSQMDLIIFYSPEKACVTYYINNDSAGYKIEYPFAWIKNISLIQGEMNSVAEGASQPGALVMELNRPPKFYMDSSGSGGFYECGDFTEDQQASSVMVHQLGGPVKILSGQLAKLVSLDAFQNRHHLNASTFTVSAPVSPVGHRPSSQPNNLMHPHTHVSLFQEQQMGLMGPPGPRGHKRQRSRSVPVAIDFSSFRNNPMPSFLIQQEPVAPAHQMHEPTIFAPQPQHHHSTGFTAGPIGPNLSIDTSAGYGMDLRQFAGPMSATTLNSPSEFGTPSFFSSGPTTDAMAHQTFSTPYSSSFLSVDAAAMIGTSNTPISFVGHGDPVIADQSPPLTGMHRSQSADIFSTPGEHNSLSDDVLSLDMYAKPMNMSFRSPLGPDSDQNWTSPFSEEHFHYQTPAQGPTSYSHKMNLPFRTHDMAYQSPTQQIQHQMHQDSGIAFTSPASHMYQTPNEKVPIMYQDAKMYQSPAQMGHNPSKFQTPAQHMHHSNYQTPAHQMHDDSGIFQSPLGGDETHDDADFNNFVQFGTIDPSSL